LDELSKLSPKIQENNWGVLSFFLPFSVNISTAKWPAIDMKDGNGDVVAASGMGYCLAPSSLLPVSRSGLFSLSHKSFLRENFDTLTTARDKIHELGSVSESTLSLLALTYQDGFYLSNNLDLASMSNFFIEFDKS